MLVLLVESQQKTSRYQDFGTRMLKKEKNEKLIREKDTHNHDP